MKSAVGFCSDRYFEFFFEFLKFVRVKMFDRENRVGMGMDRDNFAAVKSDIFLDFAENLESYRIAGKDYAVSAAIRACFGK